MLKLLCLALLGLAIPSWGAFAQAVADDDAFRGLPNVRIEYYDVHGTDEETINASLSQNAPVRPDGSTAMAATRYTMQYRPLLVGKGAACRVGKLDDRPGAVVRLPRLVDIVPERIMVRWRPFVAGLRVHEAGHVRIEYAHIRDVEAAMVGHPCSESTARFRPAMERIVALQHAYDRETDDGITQGAILH